MITIRPYRGADEASLIALWNATLTQDRINESVFRTKVLLDPNFTPAGLLLAESDGELRGFVLSLTRQAPLFLQGLEPETAWITAFGVHPDFRRQGIGQQLLDAALIRLTRLGRKRVLISPYTPNYFIPGVDIAAYADAVAFLQANGWAITSQPISMRTDVTSFQIPLGILELEAKHAREDQIVVRPVQSTDLPELMPFIVQHFGWDWYRFAQEYLLELFGAGSDEICFLVATWGDHIIGYCQQRRERFGPFGVAEQVRNKGIGRLLLFRCLDAMRIKGFHCAWFLWTGQNASRLYSLAGFKPVRQFAVMKRDL
jgi:mycothiol synthase